jgi:hypothetical protein
MALGKQNYAIHALKTRLDYLSQRCKPGRKDTAKHIAELGAALKILEAAEAMSMSADPPHFITICGIRYAFGLFDHLGFGPEGTVLRIGKRDDGVVTLYKIEEKSNA